MPIIPALKQEDFFKFKAMVSYRWRSYLSLTPQTTISCPQESPVEVSVLLSPRIHGVCLLFWIFLSYSVIKTE